MQLRICQPGERRRLRPSGHQDERWTKQQKAAPGSNLNTLVDTKNPA